MALEYSAVQWNRQKRIYDFVLAVGVGAFLILFGVLSKGYRGCRCAQPPANFWQASGLRVDDRRAPAPSPPPPRGVRTGTTAMAESCDRRLSGYIPEG